MTPPNALAIPDNADQLPGGQELLRVWMSDEGERVTLHVPPELPIGAWGILLADVAHHAARAYAQKRRGTVAENLREVVSHLIAELQAPTEEVQGEIGG